MNIFIAYSHDDKDRIHGLSLLLSSVGHKILSYSPELLVDRNYKYELKQNLLVADALLIFWSKNASRSDLVRCQYEYFMLNCPNKSVIPVLTDETCLPGAIKKYQSCNIMPVINELLLLQRTFERKRFPRKVIQSKIIARLKKSGLKIGGNDLYEKLFLIGATVVFTYALGVFDSSNISIKLLAPQYNPMLRIPEFKYPDIKKDFVRFCEYQCE